MEAPRSEIRAHAGSVLSVGEGESPPLRKLVETSNSGELPRTSTGVVVVLDARFLFELVVREIVGVSNSSLVEELIDKLIFGVKEGKINGDVTRSLGGLVCTVSAPFGRTGNCYEGKRKEC